MEEEEEDMQPLEIQSEDEGNQSSDDEMPPLQVSDDSEEENDNDPDEDEDEDPLQISNECQPGCEFCREEED